MHRTSDPFLVPDQEFEIKGQIHNVVFVQGLVRCQLKHTLYTLSFPLSLALSGSLALFF